jgi:PPK2 family polyphosphate:nucleotide phosphotransferase
MAETKDPKKQEFLDDASKLTGRYRIVDGSRFHLRDIDPRDTDRFDHHDKQHAEALLAAGVELLAELQAKLWAQDRWALLVVLQALDAAGKDGVVQHVMSGVNPQGCDVASFKAPSAEELDHDFLWRCQRRLPERGRIGIFNRSYYEEVLVVRVHPEILAAQRLPAATVDAKLWERRFREIRDFERHLGENGTVVRKFFLHVSKEEQAKRFLARLDDPEKNWKFSAGDVAERDHWDAYQQAYDEAIRATATPEAPWYVVPADHKWFTRLVVAAALVETLDALDLQYPHPTPERLRDLDAARRRLLSS